MKDAVVVLSHRFDKNTKLSIEYVKRLNKAYELVIKKEANNIILCSETAINKVRDILIKKGIKHDKIFFQKKSKDTIGEAFFTKKEILIPNNWKDIIVVSSDYHIFYRARIIFDFILGEDFKIEYIGVESGRLKDPDTVKNQKNSMDNFINIFKNISPGDDNAIEKILIKNHELYKK